MSNRPRLSRPAARPNTPPLRLFRSLRSPLSAATALFALMSAAAPGVAAVSVRPSGPYEVAASRVAAVTEPAGAARSVAAQPAQPDLIRTRQWALGALRIPRTWKYTRGDGVTVAVLDTGVDGNHPDLTGSVVNGPDFTGRTRRPGSKFWGRHGTAMASIIAGHGHGPQQAAGILGAAPRTKVLSVRVTLENEDPARRDKEQLNRSRDAVAKGIRYAVDNGAQVISMSLGGGTNFYDGNPAEEEAVKYALRQGAVLVASSGNDGEKLNRRTFPAAYPGVIAVGAVNRRLRVTKFSNHNDYVSVAAPGDEIVMADAGQGYVVGTGTSPSAAYVAGIAALVRSRYPQLAPEQVRQAIEKGVTRKPDGGRNDRVGTGVVDAVRALFAARDIDRNAFARSAPQATQAAPIPEAEPRPAPNYLVIVVLIVGATVLSCGIVMLFVNLRRRARGEAAEPAAEPAVWTDDDWEGGWDARERDAAGTESGGTARRASSTGAPAGTAAASAATSAAASPASPPPADVPAPPVPLAAPVNVTPVVSTDVYVPPTGLGNGSTNGGNGNGGRSRGKGDRRRGAGEHGEADALPAESLRAFDPAADAPAGGLGEPGAATGRGGNGARRNGSAARGTNGAGPASANGKHNGNGNGNGAAYLGGAENLALPPDDITLPTRGPRDGRPRRGNGARSRGNGTVRDTGDAARGTGPVPDAAAPGAGPGDTGSVLDRPAGDDLPRRRSTRRSGRGDTRAALDPLPQADPALDMGTPIAEQSWHSLRRSRRRMNAAATGAPGTTGSPDPLSPATPPAGVPVEPPAAPGGADSGPGTARPEPSGTSSYLASPPADPAADGTPDDETPSA